MKYEYIHPRPFEKALRYDYANCAPEFFFVAWQDARGQARDFYEKVANSPSTSDTGSFLTDGSSNDLRKLLDECSLYNENAKKILWALIKKYEVFGRLYSHYDKTMRKTKHASPASIEDYVAFADVLVTYTQKEDCLQYLSTLLKILDSFCGLVGTTSCTPHTALEIVYLIDQEAALVKQAAGGAT